MILLQIDAPYFCAGCSLNGKYVDTVAPIIKYMKGWTYEEVVTYCKRKRWKVTKIDNKKARRDG